MSVEITFKCSRCGETKTQRGAIYCRCKNHNEPFCSDCIVCPTDKNEFKSNGYPMCRDCYGREVDKYGWVEREGIKYRLWDKRG